MYFFMWKNTWSLNVFCESTVYVTGGQMRACLKTVFWKCYVTERRSLETRDAYLNLVLFVIWLGFFSAF